MDQGLWWQLIDTSFKVALGGLIAAIMVWLMQWRKQNTLDNPLQNRRLVLLEQIAADVGSASHAFSKYSALLVESTRYGERWPQARKDELAEINKELVAEFKKMSDAEATLLMLGEKSMEKALRLYETKIAVFQKEVYIGRQDIPQDEITQLKTEINGLRETFYDILSRKYDRLLPS